MADFADHGLVMMEEKSFPAVISSRLAVPPASHFLDFLVRHHVVLEEEGFYDPTYWELQINDPGTVAMVFELPECDLCQLENRPLAQARYDGPTSSQPGAPWAFLCADCFALRAPPVLGMGRAQYLFTKEEIPREVKEAFFRAREFWIGRGVKPPPHHPFE